VSTRQCRQCGTDLPADTRGQFCSHEHRRVFLDELLEIPDLSWLRRFTEAPAGPDGPAEPFSLDEALAGVSLYVAWLNSACDAVEEALAALRARRASIVAEAEATRRAVFAYTDAEARELAAAYADFDLVKGRLPR
jgi:hypothetical protein